MIATSLAVPGRDKLRPRWRQLLGGASVSATLATLLVAGGGQSTATATVGSGPVTPTPGLSAGQTLSGGVFVGGGDATTAEAFGTWRGAPVQSVTAYTGTDNWADVDNVVGKGLTRYWMGLGAHMIWSVPLIPSDGKSTLEIAASGAYNANYAQVAAGLIAGGDANATIRLGWEFTGNWYAWNGINDPAAFAEAFRQAVVTMRNVSGANFTFDWSPALGQGNPSPMYPGDPYVDTIGADTFDRSWANAYPPTDHVDVWNGLMTEPFGWNWLANFAETHGKRLSLPEWGLSYMCSGHGGDDDAYFIEQMRQFINTHDVAFENYFDSDDTNCVRGTLNTGDFPAAAAQYQQLFSTPAVQSAAGPPAPPPVSAPPTTAVPPTVLPAGPAAPPSGWSVRPGAPVMWISRSPNRSRPAVLGAQTLQQSAYIFYPITTDVKSVTFLIDGKKLRSVTRSPWDLVGATASRARPLRPASLSAGWHKIVADVAEDGGGRVSATGYVYVPPADAKTLWISSARLLRAAASPAGGQTWTLNGGAVRSGQYLRLTTPPRTVRAQFILDGRVVRALRSPAGVAHVPSVSAAGLAKGKHRLEVRVRAKNGQLSDGAAVFIVK